jgi:hypothetical protein
MWKRWYHVLVELPDKRFLVAIEATSAMEARQLVADGWGSDHIREVRSAR